MYQEVKDSLRRLYLEDDRPWLVGFSGGKDSSMVASLVVEVVVGIPAEQRKKPVAILCTDTASKYRPSSKQSKARWRAFTVFLSRMISTLKSTY